MGVYYLEFADPPDPTRASKCFQKAFELDPRETEAARRLALSFADEKEWDLVEVVARRTIEGEGGLEGGLDGVDASAKAKYKPTNAWAWKALGAVELVSAFIDPPSRHWNSHDNRVDEAIPLLFRPSKWPYARMRMMRCPGCGSVKLTQRLVDMQQHSKL